jgi:hypothetical protein
VRNSSLVKKSCADNVTGLSHVPKLRHREMGRGALGLLRSGRVTDRGAFPSANAGMSNERGGRNSPAECPRVPGEGSSAQGKSGPKARPKGVVDG